MPEVHLLRPADDEARGGPGELVVTRFPCVVGRHSACDCRLGHPSVSRRHCALALRDGRVWVADLGSLNGIRLNGESLRGERPLADGDRLEFGDVAFRVQLSGCPAAGADRVTAHSP
jgi:pSer/pThr/pTyr-binding forkhead associated (FHA) protein